MRCDDRSTDLSSLSRVYMCDRRNQLIPFIIRYNCDDPCGSTIYSIIHHNVNKMICGPIADNVHVLLYFYDSFGIS